MSIENKTANSSFLEDATSIMISSYYIFGCSVMPHTAILHDMSNHFKKYAKKLLRIPKNVKIVGFRTREKL